MTPSPQAVLMDRFIDRLDHLHTAPQIAFQVLKLLQNEDFETRRLVECLEADPALAASVLRLVNSSYFGLSRNVASLQHAVTYLGSRSLRLAVLGFGLLKQLVADAPAQLYQEYWRRSLTMAAVASRLASYDPGLKDDEAYSAGLLADVGVLLLAQLETKSYTHLCQRVGHSTLLVESEHELYGFDHGGIGAHLLNRWNLPENLIAAVAGHHALPDSRQVLSLSTHVANLMADALWTSATARVQDVRRLLEAEYGLGIDGFITLAVECKQLIQESAEIYRVQLPGQIDCDELLREARRQYMEEAMEAAIDWDSLAAVVGQE